MSDRKPRSGHSGRGGMNAQLRVARRGDLAGVEELLRRDPSLLQAKIGGHKFSGCFHTKRRKTLRVIVDVQAYVLTIDGDGYLRTTTASGS